jgi:hypothetical protein
MILLDNAAELVISRELQHQFAWDDHRHHHAGALDYTEKERRDADRFFDDKVRLAVRFGKVTKDQEAVLTASHQFRGEMFHGDRIRRAILRPATSLLFHTVTGIFDQMPPQSWRLPARDDEEHEAFMVRFGLNSESFGLGMDLVQRIAIGLRTRVENEAAALPEALSIDLVERIDTTLANLAYLNEDTDDERKIDHRMRYGQFWQAEGWKLMAAGVREPELTSAFEKWKAGGNAEFTIPRIKRWKRTSERIARSPAPEALRTYCGVDAKFNPLEGDVAEAVIEYEERIDAEIHDRRLRPTPKT